MLWGFGLLLLDISLSDLRARLHHFAKPQSLELVRRLSRAGGRWLLASSHAAHALERIQNARKRREGVPPCSIADGRVELRMCVEECELPGL